MTEHTPEPEDVFAWIDGEEQAREQAGLVRTLRPRPSDSPLMDLAGNDYLGLSRHPETIRGAQEAAERWGGEPLDRAW